MSKAQGPRIGIIGTGAIGGFYGVMLARAGFDVHFLLRSEYDAVVKDGLLIHSAVHGEMHLQPVQAYRDVADMPACDWLVVGAKTTSNADLAPLIAQAAAPGAKVLLMQNGLGVENALRPLLPDSLHLLGGLCFICVHRQAPGVVEHEAQGTVNVAYHSGPAADADARKAVAEEGAEMFRAAGVGSSGSDNIDQARWQKLVWNMPYNGLSVLLDSGTQGLMGQAEVRELIEAMMNEVIEGAAACGHALPDGLAKRMLGATQSMHDYLPSMYHDYKQKRPLELQAIYVEPLAAALASGKDLPKLRMLHQALTFIDERNLA